MFLFNSLKMILPLMDYSLDHLELLHRVKEFLKKEMPSFHTILLLLETRQVKAAFLSIL